MIGQRSWNHHSDWLKYPNCSTTAGKIIHLLVASIFDKITEAMQWSKSCWDLEFHVLYNSTLYVSTDDHKNKFLIKKKLYSHCALLHTNISVLWSGSGIKSFGSYIIFDLLQGTRLISNSSICKSSQKSTYIWSSQSLKI